MILNTQPVSMLVAVVAVWLPLLCAVAAMRADRMAQLRRETVDMFYHGYGNYMQHAFPEDEVWILALLLLHFS